MQTEDQAFEELERKIGSETIDLRPEVDPMISKRTWFRETQGWMADDVTVCKFWNEAHLRDDNTRR